MIKVMICGIGGAMGKNVEDVILEKEGIEVVCGYDKCEDLEYTYPIYSDFSNVKEDIDVIIDFSHFSITKDLVNFAVEKKIPLVCATTGLSEELEDMLRKASHKIPIFKTGNFSYGINVVTNILKKAAFMLSDGYDVEIIEKHHNKKVDAPSGTAFMLAKEVKENSKKELEYVYGRNGRDAKREEKDITIHALRGGTIVGEHSVLFAGTDEVIEIKHTAFSKKVFAVGAVKAAEFLVKKEKGYYDMEDING